MAEFYYPSLDVITTDEFGNTFPIKDETLEVWNVTQNLSLGTLSTDGFGIMAEGGFDDGVDDVALHDVIEISHSTMSGTVKFTLKASQEAAFTAFENDATTLVLDNAFTDTVEPQAMAIYAVDMNVADAVPQYIGLAEVGKVTKIPYKATVAQNLRLYSVPSGDGFQTNASDLSQYAYVDVGIPDPTSSNTIADFFEDAPTVSDSGDLLGAQWDTLYEAVIPPNKLANNGDEVVGNYSVTLGGGSREKEIRVLCNGDVVGETDILTVNNVAVEIRAAIMRTGADSARSSFWTSEFPAAYSSKTSVDFGSSVTLTLQGRTNDLKGDVTARFGKVVYVPCATPDFTPPSVPADLLAVADSDSAITLTWSASTDD